MKSKIILFFLVVAHLTCLAQDKKKYKEFRSEGDTYMEAGDLMKAKSSYEISLQNKSGDKYVTQKLKEVKNAIKVKHAQLLSEANKAYDSGNLKAALPTYNQALQYAPEDNFIIERITACSIEPGTTFMKTFGGRSYDEAQALVQLSDGSIVLAGRASPGTSSNTDMIVIKMDRDGNKAWEKKFGGDETEEALDIISTSDGNFLVVGHSDSYSGSPGIKDMFVVKLDQSGNEIWKKTYGSNVTIDEANAVVEAHTGGYLLVGNSFVNGSLEITAIKISENGDKQWERYYGGSGSEEGTDVIKTDDGYVIVGNTESKGKGKWDIWLLKVDKEGNEVWDTTFGGGDNETANAVIQTKDGGFIIAGSTYSFAFASQDFWVIKTDSEGKEIWNKPFGGLAAEEAFSLVATKDGNYVASGFQEVWDKEAQAVSDKGFDAYLVKFDDKGEKIWERANGGKNEQRAFDIAETSDGSFILVGLSKGDSRKGVEIAVLKANPQGLVAIEESEE
ncbi:tetratricopeptide repeat protein [Chondrinema litorale]|uniref:tetratricopeptide repeat protein n=1 Tax=Chondrinema litorale TaxID=2994555 RepID=UPI002543B679|nr:hypothetical protein [Chondrinema litorale]UZR94699.1 hypothetical protein OQ292_02565 [Chondrinema litorale]